MLSGAPAYRDPAPREDFEVLLITANALVLLLSFTRTSKAVWWRIVGVSLLALWIHCAREGSRWQMAFSYLFTVLAAASILARTTGRFTNVRSSKALKILTVVASSFALALTSFLAYALPVFNRPRPTGGSPVGIRYFALASEFRSDPFRKSPQRSAS